MDNEVAPPIQIATSESDDTNPYESKITTSFPGDDPLTLSRTSVNTENRNLKVPTSAPTEVDKGILCNCGPETKKEDRPPVIITNKKRLFDVDTSQEPVEEDSPTPESLNKKSMKSSSNPVSEIDNELSSSSTDEDGSDFLSGSGLQWTEKKTSRVGADFQATQLPDAGSYLNFQEDDFDQLEQLLLADQIWDPFKAAIQGINDYVHHNCPSNKKEAALEFLHQCDYDASCISDEEVKKFKVLDGSDWSLSEHENFRRLMQLTRHNINSVAKSMGKSINNCLTVYYKIINVRETRSTTKKFSGMKPMEEINELKDIGRSMRMEKRNRQKRLSEELEKDVEGKKSGRRKRRKATAPSDKVKSPQRIVLKKEVSQRTIEKSRGSNFVKRKKDEDCNESQQQVAIRKSPRTSKSTPIRLSDEQSFEVIKAAFSKQDSRKVASIGQSRNKKSYDFGFSKATVSREQGTRSTRAAKARAIISLRHSTGLAVMKSPSIKVTSNASNDRRVTRIMSKSNSSKHQNKQKQSINTGISSSRLAKTQAVQSIRRGNDGEDYEEKDETWNVSTKTSACVSLNRNEDTSDKDLWNMRYEALVDFKNRKGHCLVPKVYPEDRQLSYWVFRQRGLYTNKNKKKGGGGSLSDERVQKLKDIGFVFRAKHSKEQNMVDAARRKPQLDAKWNKFYEEFCEYREKTGSCLIPKVFEENQPLSSWLVFTRKSINNISNIAMISHWFHFFSKGLSHNVIK